MVAANTAISRKLTMTTVAQLAAAIQTLFNQRIPAPCRSQPDQSCRTGAEGSGDDWHLPQSPPSTHQVAETGPAQHQQRLPYRVPAETSNHLSAAAGPKTALSRCCFRHRLMHMGRIIIRPYKGLVFHLSQNRMLPALPFMLLRVIRSDRYDTLGGKSPTSIDLHQQEVHHDRF